MWRTGEGTSGGRCVSELGRFRVAIGEGTIDSYPLYRAAYNASCTCCGYGRWHCVAVSYGRTMRAGSLDS